MKNYIKRTMMLGLIFVALSGITFKANATLHPLHVQFVLAQFDKKQMCTKFSSTGNYVGSSAFCYYVGTNTALANFIGYTITTSTKCLNDVNPLVKNYCK